MTLWQMGRAGLAHVVPSGTSANDTRALLNLYNATPSEIHLATKPNFFDLANGFQSVRATIRTHYGAQYAGIKVFLINGYNGHDWAQEHQLAVDPKAGAYPVFN
ncbi:hypothetical protein [Aliidongia dinghuensis]|uniref:hypothetical protein n=1 Tax=Aliidongia dinghuensis TaxID=1867774 RepID=UPI00166C4528|nr:hypothetical protein [Aliidongia dinghuensis]